MTNNLEMSNSSAAPVAEENKSTSTFASTVVPYYGSREPKQSVAETDRVILQMMNDIQITIQPGLDVKEEKEWNDMNKPMPVSTTRTRNILWKFRIVLCSTVILLLVVATVVISELTKERS